MTFDKQFDITENMTDETLLNSYCEWVWYNVTQNTTSFTSEVILPDGTPDDDNPEYRLMYHIPKYNQMCLMKFNELILPEDYVDKQKHVLQKILYPYYILIVTLGLLGNCLSTCVFFGTKLRYSSTSVYLGGLAISDNCYLITILARRHLNLNTLILKTFSVFLTNFFACMSAWIVVIFTVERFIAIKWPLRSKSFCTVARAKIIIIILTITTFFVNILDFSKFLGVISASRVYEFYQNAVIVTIPMIVIMMFNILILYNIYKSYRNRRNLTEITEFSLRAITANVIAPNENQNYENWMSQATILLVSFAFIFFNVPICVSRISLYFLVDQSNYINMLLNINRKYNYVSIIYTLAIIRHIKVVKQYMSWKVIPIYIYYINFCINFLLYYVSGEHFRKELINMFKKKVNQL